MSQQLTSTFHRTVDEGHSRLTRTWPSLLATGFVGGADISLGVLALYLVEDGTQSHLLASLAFSIGFIALTLANSELFTENFLVPVAGVITEQARPWALFRLWGGTLVTNLVGGWAVTGLILVGFPRLAHVAVEAAIKPATSPLDWTMLANAVVAGAVITLMTWMERSTESVPGKLMAASIAAFLLAAGPMDHVIVVSVEMFGALHAGAPFGYSHWFGFMLFAGLGNMMGGLGLVTVLRLIQVGGDVLDEERQRDPDDPRDEPEGPVD